MADKVKLSDKKYNEVYNFLNQYVDKNAANAFKKAHSEGREIEWLNKNWNRLEEYTSWTNSYSSIEDLTASPEKQLEQIYNKNPDYDKISPARMKNILDNNDVTKEQLKSYYDYRKAQSDEISKVKEDKFKDATTEYEQIERSKDDSYFNSPLANEYARESYIKGNMPMAYYNEILGKVGGISDFAPLPWAAWGPAFRTTQKYYAGKDILTPSTFADFGGAIIPDLIEKPARLAFNTVKGGLERIIPKVGDTKIMKAIEARVNKLDSKKSSDIAKSDLEIMNTDLTKLSDKELLNLYNKANNPKLKAQIEEYFKAKGKVNEAQIIKESPMINSSKEAKDLANKKFDEANESLNKANQDFIKVSSQEQPTTELIAGNNKKEPFADNNLTPYYKDTPLSTLSEYEASKVTPNKTATVLTYAGIPIGIKSARSMLGGRLGQWDTFDPEPKDNSKQLIKDTINMYSDQWNPLEPPADYHTNSLIRAAYDEWYKDVANRPFYEAEWSEVPKTYKVLKGDK